MIKSISRGEGHNNVSRIELETYLDRSHFKLSHKNHTLESRVAVSTVSPNVPNFYNPEQRPVSLRVSLPYGFVRNLERKTRALIPLYFISPFLQKRHSRDENVTRQSIRLPSLYLASHQRMAPRTSSASDYQLFQWCRHYIDSEELSMCYR